MDFAICLELANANTGRTLNQLGIHCLNHTDYSGVRYRPIAVSIETKAAYAGDAEATLQLSTWAKAQMLYLRQLLYKAGKSSAQIITLPLVLVVGHEWRVYFIEDRGESAVSFPRTIASTNVACHILIQSLLLRYCGRDQCLEVPAECLNCIRSSLASRC